MADDRIDRVDDGVQHGIDNNPNDDAAKGAALGGLGGVAVGAAAGSMAGPVGAVIGAVIGGVAGAAASGAAVAAVDGMDNDDTVTGMGDGATADDTFDDDDYTARTAGNARDTYVDTTPVTSGVAGAGYAPGVGGLSPTTTGRVTDDALPVGQYDTATNADTGIRYETDPTLNAQNRLPGNHIPGTQTGGRDVDGTPDTRGVTEKVSDAVTGDHVDDKTGKLV